MATTPPDKLRVMVDANVLVAGLGWPRFPYEVLQHAIKGHYTLVLAPYIIDEARKHYRRLFPDTLDRFEQLLVASQYEAVPSPSTEAITASQSLVRDAADVPVALAAIHAGVDLLISQDTDLTARDESTKALHQQLTVMLPGTFLRQYMGWTSAKLEAIRHRTWSDLAEED
jgi:predicted nucleic acid-binding protein